MLRRRTFTALVLLLGLGLAAELVLTSAAKGQQNNQPQVGPRRQAADLFRGADFNPDRLIARVVPGLQQGQAKELFESHGLTIEYDLSALGQDWFVVKREQNVNLLDAAEQLVRDARILRVEGDQVVRLLDAQQPDEPQDALYPKQWGLGQRTPSGSSGVRALPAWRVTHGDPSIRVAVIDTGVYAAHPDLLEAVDPGVDLIDPSGDARQDLYGHGTRVAGILAARGFEPVGMVGVAPDVRIFPIRVMEEATGFLGEVLKALDIVEARHIPVSCNSWYLTEPSDALHDAIRRLARGSEGNPGHTFVCAAGNTGKDLGVEPTYPAAYTELRSVIAVAASDQRDALARFSSWGSPEVAVAAPGVHILTPIPTGSWSFSSGTSFATPFVAGAVALLLSKPGIGPMPPGEIRHRVVETARPSPTIGERVEARGILDIEALLR